MTSIGYEFEIKALRDNKNRFICTTKMQHSLPFAWQLVCPVIYYSLMIFIVITWIYFVVQTFKHIKSIKFYKETTVKELKRVEDLIKDLTRYCIAWICGFTVSILLKFIFFSTLSYVFVFTETPICDFIIGMMIYMICPFGRIKFDVCFGEFQKYILNKWEEQHAVAIDIIKMGDLQLTRGRRNSIISMDSNMSLESIKEESDSE